MPVVGESLKKLAWQRPSQLLAIVSLYFVCPGITPLSDSSKPMLSLADLLNVSPLAKKEPILLFSGDSSGMLQKWERSYISPFIYR